MGSKIIALVGIVASAAFVYYCVDLKKNEILDKCNIGEKIAKVTGSVPEVTDEKIEEVKEDTENPQAVAETETITTQTTFQKSDPAFGIIIDKEINVVGMFAPEEKDRALVGFIDEMCTHADCINDIRFSDDIKSVDWSKDLIVLIQYFQENRTPDASIYINSNVLHIEGKVQDQQAYKRLQMLLAKLEKDGLHIDNKTVLAEEQKAVSTAQTTSAAPTLQKEESLKTEVKETKEAEKIAETKVIQPVKSVQKESIQNVQHEVTRSKTVVKRSEVSSVESVDIDALLAQEPIRFDAQNRTLTPESQKVLDRIAERLKTQGIQKIRIKASANVDSDALVNMIVAQKRATIVQNYLRRRGISNSTTQTMTNGDEVIIEIVE